LSYETQKLTKDSNKSTILKSN